MVYILGNLIFQEYSVQVTYLFKSKSFIVIFQTVFAEILYESDFPWLMNYS